jgi:hypothetical protein
LITPSKPESQVINEILTRIRENSPWFEVSNDNRSVLLALGLYFTRDPRFLEMGQNYSFKKGILLCGPVGCGKSTIMMSLQTSFWPDGSIRSQGLLRFEECRGVATEFAEKGFGILGRYGKESFKRKHSGHASVLQYNQPIAYCFDDLGSEGVIRHFGNECLVMSEVIQDRDLMMHRYGMKTHFTTNFNGDYIEKAYDRRVRSRIRGMCNWVDFPANAKDLRK